MNTVTVGTTDLRQALQSVAPHADPDPDFPPLHRIRLQADDRAVNVTVTATNRYTAGHALVGVEDTDSPDEYAEEPFRVDLSPTNVKEILTLFKGKAGSGDEPGDTLRLDVTEQHTRVTDTSGLFEGKALTLPRYPDETNFPDVPKLIAQALARNDDGLGVTMTVTGNGELFHGMAEALAHKGRLVADGNKVALFAAAAKAYEQPLVIEPTGEGKALVISCGESFLGLLMPMRQDDDTDARHAAWRAAWLRRLPELASTS